MNGGLIFLIILIVLVILPAGAWIFFTRWQSTKRGLPPPPLSAYNPLKIFRQSNNSSSSTTPANWVRDKIASFRGKSSGGGGSRGISRSTRGFGPLDPDGAWDDRVGNESEHLGGAGGFGGADYEEQELGGLHPGAPGHYGGHGYGEVESYDAGPQELPAYGGEERGRTRSRDNDRGFIGGGPRGLDERYDEEVHGENPFGDAAERSDLRGVSPRPVVDADTGYHGVGGGHKKQGSGDTDTIGSRKSAFREGI